MRPKQMKTYLSAWIAVALSAAAAPALATSCQVVSPANTRSRLVLPTPLGPRRINACPARSTKPRSVNSKRAPRVRPRLLASSRALGTTVQPCQWSA